MGPDSGLAAAILGAMICMVSAPALVGAGVGYALGRRGGDGARGGLAGLLALVGLTVGGAAGALAVALTFFGSSFEPTLVLAPVGTAYPHDVFVIEDPAAGVDLDWDVLHLHARTPLPDSGVVRIGDLGPLADAPMSAEIEGLGAYYGASSVPTPPGFVRPVRCFSFDPWDPDRANDCDAPPERIGAIVQAREGGGAAP